MYAVSQNVPPLTCYNLDMHDPITIIFWQKCYGESWKSDDALFSHLTCIVLRHYLAKEETQETAHWCIVRGVTGQLADAIGDFACLVFTARAIALQALY